MHQRRLVALAGYAVLYLDCATAAHRQTAESLCARRQARQEQHFEEATGLLKRVLALQPANTDALVLLGFTELGLNDLPAARSAFSQALSIAPAYADATFGLPRSSSEPAICPNPPICTPLHAKALHSSEDALHPRTATFQCRQIVLEISPTIETNRAISALFGFRRGVFVASKSTVTPLQIVFRCKINGYHGPGGVSCSKVRNSLSALKSEDQEGTTIRGALPRERALSGALVSAPGRRPFPPNDLAARVVRPRCKACCQKCARRWLGWRR